MRSDRDLRDTHVQMSRWAPAWETARRIARALRRRPGFVVTVVACWTLGLTVHGVTAYLADAFFLRPPAHVRDPGRVFRLYATVVRADAAPATASRFTFPQFAELQRTLQEEADLAACGLGDIAGSVGGYYATLKVAVVSSNYFSILGVTPTEGRLFGPAHPDRPGFLDGQAVVISQSLWQKLRADSALAIGQGIRLGGRVFTVIGIAPHGFTGGEVDQVDAWTLLDSDGDLVGGADWRRGTRWWLTLVGRQRAGASVSRIEVKGEYVLGRTAEDGDGGARKVSLRVAPVLPSRGPLRSLAARAAALLALSSLVFLMLATVNVAGMLVLRGVGRRREFAVKSMLGARDIVLSAEVFGEIAVLSAFAAATSLLLILALKGVIARAFLPGGALVSKIVDWRVAGYTLASSTITAVLVGFIVWTVRAEGSLSVSATSDRASGGRRLRRAQTAILSIQAAAATALLACAGLVVSNLYALRALDLGVRIDRVVLVTVSVTHGKVDRATIDPFMESLRERVRSLPDVDLASTAVAAPFMSGVGVAINAPDHAALYETTMGMPLFNAVSADYFETVGMRILRGIAFDRKGMDPLGYVAVVNETFARNAWPQGDFVGHCLILGADPSNPCYRVVGVVADARRFTIVPEEPVMQVYVPAEQNIFAGVYPALSLVVRTRKSPETVRAQLTHLARGMLPAGTEVAVHSLEELVDPQMRPWRVGGPLFVGVGGMALLLTVVGMFGTVAFAAQQRKREMGIRMALGATLPVIVREVGASTFVASAAGIVVGGGLCAGLAARYGELLLPDVSSKASSLVILSMVLVLCVLLTAGILPIVTTARKAVLAALQAD